MPNQPTFRTLSTAPGSHRNAFGAIEWGLLAAVAGIWGSSFLLIAEALESFSPPMITATRFALGLVTLALFPAARRPVAPSDWRAIGLIALVWMVVPMYMFPVAQQWISSSLAGMINGALPLFAAVIAAFLLRKPPGRVQIVGLVIGFAGVAAVSLRGGADFDNGYLGVGLLIFAVACYGLGVNLAVPLQQRYGALPVLLRALAIATLLTLPVGLMALPDGGASATSVASLIALGALGTGLAFVAMTTLVGRAGATRGSVATYFIPIVALILGVSFRDEAAPLLSLAGIALILLGAWLTSRSEGS
ncbi:MAG: DMT family transporter [Acidimicrobiia bacterium]|nr:DMT family transporter [Acidimicrobiia bacterium]